MTATPVPSPDAETITVTAVKSLGGALVAVSFTLPGGVRRRVIIPQALATVDNVNWIGAALPSLLAVGRPHT